MQGPVPGTSLDALASALGRAAAGADVSPADVRWEPSGGVVFDLVPGRRLLFLARSAGDETRDVWRARVRVTPDGRVVSIADVRNVTSTPLGDDHALVAHGRYAAFATRAYGREQSATLLDLNGEGPQNKTVVLIDRAMAGLTNLQRTGSFAGVGRVDVAFAFPGRSVGLSLGDSALEITLWDGDPRRPSPPVLARLDLDRGELSPSLSEMHAVAAVHLPKRLSHWTVDTLRAVSFIGPAPVAWAEDQALATRDTFRRLVFAANKGAGGDATDLIAAVDPGPPVLDPSQASVDEGHWPPQRIATIWKSPEPGEGDWAIPDVPWLRRASPQAADAPSAFYQTFVRPDQDRPYAKVLLVAMDMRQLDLEMEAGVEDPEPLTGPPGPGRIPRDPSIYRRVAAAFNGAFKTEHGHYGMMVHKRVLIPPLPGAATVVVLSDGRAGFGTWGADKKVGGIVGVPDGDIASYRQNLDPLVDHGQVNPTGRNLWGFTLPGKGAQTERSGLCVTTGGHLVYAWADDANATSLARALQMAGCDYGMHLDMNPYHTGFLFTAIDDFSSKKYKTQLFTTAMSIPTDRYVQYSPKDFFYVLAHDPTPPPVEGPGAKAWAADEGVQPPPHWMAGVFRTHLDDPDGGVDLIEIEAGRATWRIRAGAKDAAGASPLREIAGDEAKRVFLAVGMGVAPDRRPLGLATDGRLAEAVHGSADSALLVVGPDGKFAIERADAAPPLEIHDDLAELPIVLWDGRYVSPPNSQAALKAQTARSALGLAAAGRVVLARTANGGPASLADALARVGCARGVLLDRGLLATARVDRAGTPSAPRSGYEETVLYGIGSPLRPRGFRFESTSPVAQRARLK